MKLTPSYIFFKYTDECNSRCTSCFLWKKRGETMEVEMASRLGRFVDPCRLKEFHFTGGEPLLPGHAADMAIALHKFCPGVYLSGSTNGMEPEVYLPKVARMKRAGVNYFVAVSLNGRRETHEATRGVVGSYGSAVLMAWGLKHLNALASLNMLEYPGITTDEDRKHVDELAATIGTQSWRSHLLRRMPWFGQEDDGATIAPFDCYAIKDVICVHPNGDITACQEPRPNLVLGNLADEGLDEDRVREATRIVTEQQCQPCGCCTLAYTHGSRCLT